MPVTKWSWNNTTQVFFGENSVAEHLKDFIKPNSKVLCVFGGGSIDKNGARKDVHGALDALSCEVKWEGGIPPNPEYERCIEILKVVREWHPDVLLAVGGGSVIDGTKFIHSASALPESQDPWEIFTKSLTPKPTITLGVVLTLPATGSEWNNCFVVSRRAMNQKLSAFNCYPTFSIIDPKYTMTLPVRQLRNGLYDAMCHCIDSVITPHVLPLMDNLFYSVMRELVDISKDLLKPNSSLELHSRLIEAASFALNQIFAVGKKSCWGIHFIGHQLTVKYGMDHGATLSIITPPFLRLFIEGRKYSMARAAERVFDITEGSDYDKAKQFIEHLTQWIKDIGQPLKVSDYEGAKIESGDVEEITKMVMASMGNHPFGYNNAIRENDVRKILEQVIQ